MVVLFIKKRWWDDTDVSVCYQGRGPKLVLNILILRCLLEMPEVEMPSREVLDPLVGKREFRAGSIHLGVTRVRIVFKMLKVGDVTKENSAGGEAAVRPSSLSPTLAHGHGHIP